MSWKYISVKGTSSGKLIDGSFIGRNLLSVDFPKRKRPYVHWIKKFITEGILWIGARY